MWWGAQPSDPEPAVAVRLKQDFPDLCRAAASKIHDADVLLICTGAGFSADSGLAVYRDIATVKPYQNRNLAYQDVCEPHWLDTEPEFFYGWWGMCYNNYRDTAPHAGFGIVQSWRDSKRGSEAARALTSRSTDLGQAAPAQATRSAPYSVDGTAPYSVDGTAGSFFLFTSNVDAHSFDHFEAHEIRECHGNVELWQCSRLCSESIWRAPESFRFAVDEDTMLAPAGPPAEPLPCGPLVEDRDVAADVTISLTRTGQQPPWGFELQFSSQGSVTIIGVAPGSIAARHPELVPGVAIVSINGVIAADFEEQDFRHVVTASSELVLRLECTATPDAAAADVAPAAVGNAVTARSSNLVAMTTASSIGPAAIQTTGDSAQAALAGQGQAIQAAGFAQGEGAVPPKIKIGRTTGTRRSGALRHMPACPTDPSLGFRHNHPRCIKCEAPARPAILMFQDTEWIDNEDQEKRWAIWARAVMLESRQRRDAVGPALKVAVVEIGCGQNVPTVRRTTESFMSNVNEAGGCCDVVRINPELPLPDADDANTPGFISIMSRGLRALTEIDRHISQLRGSTTSGGAGGAAAAAAAAAAATDQAEPAGEEGDNRLATEAEVLSLPDEPLADLFVTFGVPYVNAVWTVKQFRAWEGTKDPVKADYRTGMLTKLAIDINSVVALQKLDPQSTEGTDTPAAPEEELAKSAAGGPVTKLADGIYSLPSDPVPSVVVPEHAASMLAAKADEATAFLLGLDLEDLAGDCESGNDSDRSDSSIASSSSSSSGSSGSSGGGGDADDGDIGDSADADLVPPLPPPRLGRPPDSSASLQFGSSVCTHEFEAMNSTEVGLKAGEGVNILARCDETGSAEWCKVETADGRRGYVATANLDVMPDVAAGPAATTGLSPPLDRSPNHWSQVGWQRPSTPVFEPAIRDRVSHFSNMFMCLPSRGHDEVVPGIIIAEAEAALDLGLIQRLGVTHLVNTCEMRDEDRGTFREGFCVDTGPEYYGDGVTYHGFHAMDASDYDLSVHFGAANKFIGYCVEYCEAPAAAATMEAAATMHSCRIKPGFGKVMVHCKAGASRSAAIVVAFLLSIGWDLDYAIDKILDSREIAPNNGFVGLLAQYEADCQTSSSA